MKISQMTTDQAADVLVRIVDPVSNIVNDEEFIKVLEKLAEADSSAPIKFLADNLAPIVGIALKSHKADVFEIVAALNKKTTEEVAKQKITKTIKDVMDSWDGELVDFFGSLRQSRETKATK